MQKSQLEWMAAAGTSGAPVASSERRLSLADVALHRSAGDAWVAIRGRVYDVSSYLSAHPGGAKSLLSVAGKDGTAAFERVHRWVNAAGILAHVNVGVLAAADAPRGGPAADDADSCVVCCHVAGDDEEGDGFGGNDDGDAADDAASPSADEEPSGAVLVSAPVRALLNEMPSRRQFSGAERFGIEACGAVLRKRIRASGADAIVWPGSAVVDPDCIGIIADGGIALLSVLPLLMAGSSSGEIVGVADAPPAAAADEDAIGLVDDDEEEEEEDASTAGGGGSGIITGAPPPARPTSLVLAAAAKRFQACGAQHARSFAKSSASPNASVPFKIILRCKLERTFSSSVAAAGVESPPLPRLAISRQNDLPALLYVSALADECPFPQLTLWCEAGAAADGLALEPTTSDLLERLRRRGVRVYSPPSPPSGGGAGRGGALSEAADIERALRHSADAFPKPGASTVCVLVGDGSFVANADRALRNGYYVATQFVHFPLSS